MARKSTNNDTKHLVQVNLTWYLRVTIDGKQIKQSLHTPDLFVARQRRNAILDGVILQSDRASLLQSVQEQLAKTPKSDRAFAALGGTQICDVFKKWQADPTRRDITPHSMDNYRYAWSDFREWLLKTYPAVQYLSQLTKAIAREYIIHVKNTTYGTETARKRLNCIRAMLNIVGQYEEDYRNCFEGLKYQNQKSNSQRKEPFTDDEMRKIFSADNPYEFRLMSAVMYYLALRWSEATRLTWEMIDGDYINATHTKTGADATTRIPPQLRELLEQTPPNRRIGNLFPTYSLANTNHLYMRQLRELGIETQREVIHADGTKTMQCVKGAHSFRHTAITTALRNGESAAAVRRLAGHATEEMQRHYTHLDADVAGKVAESLGKFW